MRKIDIVIAPLIFLLVTFAFYVYYELPDRGQENSKELVLAMSQFQVRINDEGEQEYVARDAQVLIVHPDEGWRTETIYNPDSNVAHKALIADIDRDGLNELYVAGGQNATLKRYDKINGSWQEEIIWEPPFVRVRDLETADVDGDGENEIVAPTHRDGVAAVIELENGEWSVTEVDRRPNTFLHEIEVADIDNDGIYEFFSDPTAPNLRLGMRQHGNITMYKWNGSTYERILVEDLNYTHTKEIATGDLDNDGYPELIAVLWGIAEETNLSGQDIQDKKVTVGLEIPLKLKMYDFDGGKITGHVIAEIPEIKTRSLKVGDADNDGLNELVVGADTTGLQIVWQENGEWKRDTIDENLTGNIHEVMVIDVDGDGLNEIIANADLMGVVNMYEWTRLGWRKQTVIENISDYWVWAMDYGDVDNE